jgi:hypothetical protein
LPARVAGVAVGAHHAGPRGGDAGLRAGRPDPVTGTRTRPDPAASRDWVSCGDLDRSFARLRLEEGFLYAYGFMAWDTFKLLHRRYDTACRDGRHVPEGPAAEVLHFVRSRKLAHPCELAERFGTERAMNGWDGFSKATTRAL